MNNSKTTLYFAFLALQIFGILCQNYATHGEQCGPDLHCTADVGLICSETCKCGNGTLTDSLEYLMTWDTAASKCLATESSACTGTRQNPGKVGIKQVSCLSGLHCEQIGNLPPGVGICVSNGQSHGEPCGPSQHCQIDVGLICEKNTCQCGNGTLTESLKYTMTWEATTNICVGLEGGACIGNEENPIAEDTLKKVPCLTGLICEQEADLPLGVGKCVLPGEDGPTSTQPSTGPTSTAPTTRSPPHTEEPPKTNPPDTTDADKSGSIGLLPKFAFLFISLTLCLV